MYRFSQEHVYISASCLFYACTSRCHAPPPFFEYCCKYKNALLAKLNVSVTVAFYFLFDFVIILYYYYYYYLCVSVCLCGGQRLTDTALVGCFHCPL